MIEDKRLLPPPLIVGSVEKQKNGYALKILTMDGEEKTLISKSKGLLRRQLLYFRTLDRALIESLIPAGPAQKPKKARTVRNLAKIALKAAPIMSMAWTPKFGEDMKRLAPLSLTIADVLRRKRQQKEAV